MSNTTVTRTKTNIAVHGSFTHDTDLLAEQMTRTRADLYTEVKTRLDGDGITGLSKLRKHELAAMLADWATASRDNEREYQAKVVGITKATVEPVTVGQIVVGKGKAATTVAQLVADFRAEGAKGRRANAEGNHDIVPTTLANRIDMGNLLVSAHLVGLVRNLFAEQQDLLALHPATKADPATRAAAQERLSVAKHNIAGYLTYPVAKTALRAA